MAAVCEKYIVLEFVAFDLDGYHYDYYRRNVSHVKVLVEYTAHNPQFLLDW
jgi:hypothetical protein